MGAPRYRTRTVASQELPSTPIAVRVSGERRHQLEQLASSRGGRLTDVVRDALEHYLADTDPNDQAAA